MVPRLRIRLVLALTSLVLVACGAAAVRLPAQTTATAVAKLPPGAPAHIAVIVMENHEYGDVVGSSSAPYINGLASRSALADRMYAITHPSLPNYLALTGGSTFGITSDCTSCRVGASSLVDQLQARHVSWKAYMESLPRPCFTGAGAGDYAKKHDPFLYYTRVAGNPARCAHVVPLSELRMNEAARSLPRFVWISPNLCNDTHDCSVGTGDRFLAGLVPPLLKALGPRGLLLITWDEGTSDDGCCRLAAGGHIATILAGPLARAGARLATPVDHYSVLQLTEDLLGLPRLRGAGCACTPSLRPLLVP